MKTIGVLAMSLMLNLSIVSKAFAVFDDGARYAFIASASSKSIFIIDLHERSLAHTIALTRAPSSVAVSERLKALVVGHEAEDSLTLIDLSSAELTQIAYPLDLTPSTIEMSPVGETVAIFDKDAGRLEVHAFRRRAVLLSVDNVQTESEFTFSSDGAMIFWVDDKPFEGTVVDAEKEQQRIRENQALGKPITEGETPQVKKKRAKKGLLEF